MIGLKRYYVYAPDATGHPFLFAPFTRTSSLSNLQFNHAIIDCGFSYLLKYQDYPENFLEDYLGILNRTVDDKSKFWCVSPDYPCEPRFFSYTSLEERIFKTVNNAEYCVTKSSLCWMIPLQGLTVDDYLSCISLYEERGIDLDVVGIGTVCKRKNRQAIRTVIRKIRQQLPNSWIHAFGLTLSSLRDVKYLIDSFDSAAYNFQRMQWLANPFRPLNWKSHQRSFNTWKKKVDSVLNEVQQQSFLK